MAAHVLKATTVSGTMVMGLGPPIYLMLFWRFNSAPGKEDGFRQSPLAFALSFIPGVVFGFLYQVQGYTVRRIVALFVAPSLRAPR